MQGMWRQKWTPHPHPGLSLALQVMVRLPEGIRAQGSHFSFLLHL